WISCLRQRDHVHPSMSLHDAGGSPGDDDPDECANSPGSGGRSGCDDAPQPASLCSTEEPATPPSRRTRTRRRPKTPQVESSAASWVQVQPGRFIRVEEMSPEQPADEAESDSRPDEPDVETSSAELGAPVEADLPAADADAEVLEPGVEADHAGQ